MVATFKDGGRTYYVADRGEGQVAQCPGCGGANAVVERGRGPRYTVSCRRCGRRWAFKDGQAARRVRWHRGA